MKKKITLLIDAAINLTLGILLLLFNPSLTSALGVPDSKSNFYPNILGAVFIGITLALLLEFFRKKENEFTGLGLIGAIFINLCGGLVLTLWLIFGDLNLPLRGNIFLWGLALILLVISGVELFFNLTITRNNK